MIGGTLGAVLLMAFMPIAAKVSLLIQTPGKFALIFFALVVIVIVEKGNLAKAAIAMLLGLMIATIGIEDLLSVPRFTFGTESLIEGIDLMPLVIGAFAISEILVQAQNWRLDKAIDPDAVNMIKITRRDFIPLWSEVREIGIWLNLESTIIGYLVGILPGAGGRWPPSYPISKRAGRPASPRNTAMAAARGSLPRNLPTMPCAAAPSCPC